MNAINITYNNSTISPNIIAVFCYIIVLIVMLVALWKIFVKAGKPGWAIFVPFYGNYCEFDIAFGNGWLFLLMFVPVVNFVVMFMMIFKLGKAFGKGTGFGFGLLFLPFIFIPILGFDNSSYIGPR